MRSAHLSVEQHLLLDGVQTRHTLLWGGRCWRRTRRRWRRRPVSAGAHIPFHRVYWAVRRVCTLHRGGTAVALKLSTTAAAEPERCCTRVRPTVAVEGLPYVSDRKHRMFPSRLLLSYGLRLKPDLSFGWSTRSTRIQIIRQEEKLENAYQGRMAPD